MDLTPETGTAETTSTGWSQPTVWGGCITACPTRLDGDGEVAIACRLAVCLQAITQMPALLQTSQANEHGSECIDDASLNICTPHTPRKLSQAHLKAWFVSFSASHPGLRPADEPWLALTQETTREGGVHHVPARHKQRHVDMIHFPAIQQYLSLIWFGALQGCSQDSCTTHDTSHMLFPASGGTNKNCFAPVCEHLCIWTCS
jgi:hypothetical protein